MIRQVRAASYRGPVSVDTPDSHSHYSIDSKKYLGPVSVDTPQRIITEPYDEEEASQDEMKLLDAGKAPLETTSAVQEDIVPKEAVEEDLRDVSTLGGSIMSESEPTTTTTPQRLSHLHPPDVARKLLGAFQCAGDEPNVAETMQKTLQESAVMQRVMDLFYDKTPVPEEPPKPRGPVYDHAFTDRFVHRMTTKGAALLYLQAPGTPGNDTYEWKGRTVAMVLEKGTAGGHKRGPTQPRLEWTTCAGGQTFEVATTSVGLLNILSITTSTQDDSQSEDIGDEDLCFFTITTHQGDVYVFESNSPAERDSLVNGLRNTISRLAFQLIVGDVSATAGLYDYEESKGDLEDQRQQTMNRVAHLMLD